MHARVRVGPAVAGPHIGAASGRGETPRRDEGAPGGRQCRAPKAGPMPMAAGAAAVAAAVGAEGGGNSGGVAAPADVGAPLRVAAPTVAGRP